MMHATRSPSTLCGGTHVPSRWGHGNERAYTVSLVKNLYPSSGGGAKHDEEYQKNRDQKGAILNLAHATRGHGAGRLLAPSRPNHGRGLETHLQANSLLLARNGALSENTSRQARPCEASARHLWFTALPLCYGRWSALRAPHLPFGGSLRALTFLSRLFFRSILSIRFHVRFPKHRSWRAHFAAFSPSRRSAAGHSHRASVRCLQRNAFSRQPCPWPLPLSLACASPKRAPRAPRRVDQVRGSVVAASGIGTVCGLAAKSSPTASTPRTS